MPTGTKLPSQFFIALISFGFMLFYSGSLTLIAVILAFLMTLSTVLFLPTLQQKVMIFPRGKSTLATLQKERISLIQRQMEIQNQLNRDRRELQQIQSDLQKSLVKAPVDGIVLNLNLRNLGQFVRSGEEIAQIAPSQTKFVLRAMVSAEDISKVKIGYEYHLSSVLGVSPSETLRERSFSFGDATRTEL